MLLGWGLFFGKRTKYIYRVRESVCVCVCVCVRTCVHMCVCVYMHV